VDALTALRAVTSEAAWQIFVEDTRGTLEPGKFADFVILDQDPLSVPRERIKDIKVVEVVIGGGPAETAGRRSGGR
jgi:predicted amidohydrolase YtcJ